MQSDQSLPLSHQPSIELVQTIQRMVFLYRPCVNDMDDRNMI